MVRSNRNGIRLARGGSALLAVLACWPIASPVRAETPRAEEAAAIPSDPARLLAVVGEHPILLADVEPKVEQFLAQIEASGQTIPDHQREQVRAQVVRKALAEVVQMKMLYQAFVHQLAGNQPPDEAKEMENEIRTRARKAFYEDELPNLMKRLELNNLAEMDAKLRENGSSLERREREFIDSMIGHLYITQEVPNKPEVSAAEMLEYYRTNAAEFDRPARARWEQLSIHFARVADRDAAYRAIAEMGNEALFGGSMQAVAREKSHGLLANEGGVHDWTSKGSLVSEVLDDAIFSLPIGKMSQIIEDEQGLHVIRVLEREDAGRAGFADVQDEIREKLQQQKRKKLQEEFLTKLRERIPVWSLFPEDLDQALPLERVADRPAAGERR